MTFAYLHFANRRARDAAISHWYPDYDTFDNPAEKIGLPVNRRRYTPMEPHPSSRRTTAGYYYRVSEADAARILSLAIKGMRRVRGNELREFWI